MKSWTTVGEFAWLSERAPDWRKLGSNKRRRKEWLESTVASFLKTFAPSGSAREKAPARVKHWFYNHAKLVQPQPPSVPSIDLSSKTPRKLVPLTLAQAYSRVFCERDSPLYKELRGEWKRFTTDPTVLEKYKHLFTHARKMPFVAFQQTILRETVTTLTEDELAIVHEHINTAFEEELELREYPWVALKVDESQSKIDLERQYMSEQVQNLPQTLGAACEEIKRVTNFTTFTICGGPNPKGVGGFQIWHVGCGESLLTGQTFQEFLGPQWKLLKEKYWEWLTSVYSEEDLRRLAFGGAVQSEESPASSSTPALLQPPTLPAATTPASSQPPTLPAATTPASSQPPTLPAATTPASSQLPTSPAATTPIPSAVAQDTSMSSPTPTRLVMTNQPTEDRLDQPTFPNTLASNLPGLQDEDDQFSFPSFIPAFGLSGSQHKDDLSTPPPDASGSDDSTSDSSTSEDEDDQRSPRKSWDLRPHHRAYVHAAVPYLAGVSGTPEWEKLLATYITFESLSSSRSGLSKLPTSPRPNELPVWFKNGRRLGEKSIPQIEDIDTFEETWVAWWLAAQPQWRQTRGRSYERTDTAERDWGHLLDGGKDGIFLAVISLGWWVQARARYPPMNSKIDTAIADVTWVLDNVVSALSASAIAGSESPPNTPPPASRKKRPQATKKINPSSRHRARS